MALGVRRLLGLESMNCKGSFAIRFMQVRDVHTDKNADGDVGPLCTLHHMQGWDPATTLKAPPQCIVLWGLGEKRLDNLSGTERRSWL